MSTTRRAFLTGSFALLGAPLAAAAQQAGKVWRIGFLTPDFKDAPTPRVLQFTRGLRDLGYVEGRNLALKIRHAEREGRSNLQLSPPSWATSSRRARLQ